MYVRVAFTRLHITFRKLSVFNPRTLSYLLVRQVLLAPQVRAVLWVQRVRAGPGGQEGRLVQEAL